MSCYNFTLLHRLRRPSHLPMGTERLGSAFAAPPLAVQRVGSPWAILAGAPQLAPSVNPPLFSAWVGA